MPTQLKAAPWRFLSVGNNIAARWRWRKISKPSRNPVGKRKPQDPCRGASPGYSHNKPVEVPVDTRFDDSTKEKVV
jgi:hypothetical protein